MSAECPVAACDCFQTALKHFICLQHTAIGLAINLASMTCRSYQGLLSIITQYPITFACGSLVLVFIVPKATAFGLVGVERALLSFLLELEQLLVAALLTGAKWVCSNLDTHICRIVWLSLRDGRMLHGKC